MRTVPVLAELRDAFARAKNRRGHHDNELGVEEALDQLRPSVVVTLASFVGYQLPDLDAYFELLPVGTRMELDAVGAIQLLDEHGGDRYGLRIRPFAVDIINAAHDRVAGARSDHPRDELADALAAVRREREVNVPLDQAADVVIASGGEVVGVVELKGTTLEVDEGSQTGWVQVLDPADPRRPVRALPPVCFPLTVASGPLRKGQLTKVTFAVKVKKSSARRVTPTGKDLRVALHDGRVTVAPRDVKQANAVATVTAVTGTEPAA